MQNSNNKNYSKLNTSEDDNANVKYYARLGLKVTEKSKRSTNHVQASKNTPVVSRMSLYSTLKLR